MGTLPHDGYVLSARFTSDGKRILTASVRSVRTWYADLEELRKQAFALPVRGFTDEERQRYSNLLEDR